MRSVLLPQEIQRSNLFSGGRSHSDSTKLQTLGVDLAAIQSLFGHADVDTAKHDLHVLDPVRLTAIAKYNSAFFVTTMKIIPISSSSASPREEGNSGTISKSNTPDADSKTGGKISEHFGHFK